MNQLFDLVVATPPTQEPITIADAKAHLRVTHSAEDALIATYIATARSEAEAITARAIMRQAFELRIGSWPTLLYLPRPPLVAVTSVKYTNDSGVTQTLPAAAYTVRVGSAPGYIQFDPDQRPADTLAPAGPILVTYTAGWATPTAVPAGLRGALLLMVADLYTNRAPTDAKNTTALTMLLRERVLWEDWIQ